MESWEVKLRHPLERRVFWAYAILNVLILATALFIVFEGSNWLRGHPRLEPYHTRIRALAIAAVVGLPATIFLRNSRHALVRGKSVEISPRQLPKIYAILQRHCETLGMNPVPELYLSDMSMPAPAKGYKSWKQNYIVLSSKFFQPDLRPMFPLFSFWIGHEIGRLRLGHASWPTDLLLSYVDKIPRLSNPLRRLFTYSEDRYGAFLAPEGLPGLIGLVTGRLMLPQIDVDYHLQQVRNYGSVWARLGEMTEPAPTVSRRIKALFEAGLLKDEPLSANKESVVALGRPTASGKAS